VAAGSSVTVTAHNLPAGQQGTIVLGSTPQELGRFKADGRGDVAQDVRIPADAAGQHSLQLCWNGSCRLSAGVTVRRPGG
ncbi:MAG: hypothetical protein ABI838_06530, partial [Chloroflexota bacterium]